ncbi:DUF1353 domain-containing protein [Piscinibacter gummiphilus]|uniref:DUF1353 domain-containing protein n=1 Tax=Piscinibacter gummiphilus TaxID=946333 RepID=A0ABZ0CNE2_9BURK|nr:DUF1353 domain-containing protein [Piscinibacter gummiphilus]WOB06485.1 DUF1353 domain-containing protein [Piscinibacter gummiphilus]
MTALVEIVFTDSKGRRWVVPELFTTDGASIPRFLWSLIGSPFTGKYRLPAVAHDAAYQVVGQPKADADRMFHEAMLEQGVGRVKAWAMYSAVRLFGGDPYAQAQARGQQRERALQALAEFNDENGLE